MERIENNHTQGDEEYPHHMFRRPEVEKKQKDYIHEREDLAYPHNVL